MSEPLIHHSDGPPTIPDDWYDFVFDDGKSGDWFWQSIKRNDGLSHRCLFAIVPSPRGFGQGPLKDRGLELIQVFPRHADGNWAVPGEIDGWDGNEQSPTFTPSIFVGGNTDDPGWHGFIRNGKLSNA